MEDQDIEIYNDWTEVGYPSRGDSWRNDAIEPLTVPHDIQIIYAFDACTQTWYVIEEWNTFQPGKGYSMDGNHDPSVTWHVKHDPPPI